MEAPFQLWFMTYDLWTGNFENLLQSFGRANGRWIVGWDQSRLGQGNGLRLHFLEDETQSDPLELPAVCRWYHFGAQIPRRPQTQPRHRYQSSHEVCIYFSSDSSCHWIVFQRNNIAMEWYCNGILLQLNCIAIELYCNWIVLQLNCTAIERC